MRYLATVVIESGRGAEELEQATGMRSDSTLGIERRPVAASATIELRINAEDGPEALVDALEQATAIIR